jgi:flagellar biosynthesis protein FliQ/DNA-directed RNA polymerase subunit RPC12/RpoP
VDAKMSFALLCKECGRPMSAEQESSAAIPSQTIWRCSGCGARVVQKVPPMSAEQIREQLQAAANTGLARGRAIFAGIRWAMTLIASGTLGLVTWFLSHSVVAMCMVVGFVVLFLVALELIQRLYYVPRQINRMIEKILEDVPPNLRGS